MFKKYMCLVLCMLMVLCTVSTTASAAHISVDGLSASYVSFTSGGTPFTSIPDSAATVTASVSVSNASANAAPVILWVGKYVDDILTDVKYVRQSIAGNATDVPVSVSIDGVQRETKTDKDGNLVDKSVVLKAFVWTSFTGGKALAPTATVPSDDDTVLYVTKNGEPWTEFDQSTTTYSVVLDREAREAVPTFNFAAKDNATQIEEPDVYKTGSNIVKVKTAAGTEKDYTINIAYTKPNITINTPHENISAITLQSGKMDSFVGLFTDRMNYKSTVVGSALLGLDYITIGTRKDGDADQDRAVQGIDQILYTMTSDVAGTAYVVMGAQRTTFASRGWTLVGNSAPVNPDTGAAYTATDQQNLYANLEKRTATDAPYAILWGQVDSKNVMNYVSNYVYCYAKDFAVGEPLEVPTIGADVDTYITCLKFNDPAPLNPTDATLESLQYKIGDDSYAISGFAAGSAGAAYNVTLPALTSSVKINAAASQGDDAAIAVTSNTTVGAENEIELVDRKATATVTVTAPDGVTQQTYIINFTAEKHISEQMNKIYDVDISNMSIYMPSRTVAGETTLSSLKLQGAPATDKFYVELGGSAEYNTFAAQDGLVLGTSYIATNTTSKKFTEANTSAMFAGATVIQQPTDLVRQKIFAYNESGTIDTNAASPDGGAKYQPFMSGAFGGEDKGEPYWFTFKVTSPCTVYVSALSGLTEWYNAPSDWTKNTDNSLKLANNTAFYYKAFNAGDMVKIPNYGSSDALAGDKFFWEPNAYVIIWSTEPPSTDASISGITLNGTAVSGVSSTDVSGTRYAAKTAYGATEAVVVATATDANATVTYSPADGKAASIPGTVEINVTAEDGETTATYYVDITEGLPPSDNAKLSTFTYSVNGETPVAVTGFDPADEGGEYNVELPAYALSATLSGTKADESATINDAGAVADVSVSGNSAKLVVTSGDGTVIKDFKVNFTLAPAYQDATAAPRTLTYTAGSAVKVPDYEPMDYTNTRTDYVVKLPADLNSTKLGFQKRMTREGDSGAFTEENQTIKVYPSATVSVGETAKVAITSADGTKTNTYTIKVEQYAAAETNGLTINVNPEHPNPTTAAMIKVNPSAVDVGVGFYPDRNPQHPWANVSSTFKGATQIWTPIDDSTRNTGSTGEAVKAFMASDKEYFNFKAEKAGRVYVMCPDAKVTTSSNYTSEKGWTAIPLAKPAGGAVYDWNTVFGEYSAARYQYGSNIDGAWYTFTMNGFYKKDGTFINPAFNIIGNAVYKDFAANTTVSIPVPGISTQENPTVIIVWREASSNAKLSSFTYNVGGGNVDKTVNGFTAEDEGGTYSVTIPAGISTVNVAAAAADTTASVSFSDNVVGGSVDVSSGSAQVTVTVKAEDLSTKTFTVNFEVEKLIGEITTNGTGISIEKADAPLALNSGLFKDRMNWLAPVIGKNLIGLDYFPVYAKDTNAKALCATDGIYFSFEAKVPLTMYVAASVTMQTFEARGWKLVANNAPAKNPSTGNNYTTTELDNLYQAGTGEVSTTSPYAISWAQRDDQKVNATFGHLNYGNNWGYCYAKTFEAGETVEIPTPKHGNDAPYVPAVKYYIPALSTGTDASLLRVACGSAEAEFDGVDTYNVVLPAGTTAAKLSAVVNAIGATAVISNENLTFAGNGAAVAETITVTAPDGSTTKVYTVNVSVDIPLSEQNDKVYDLRTATGATIYNENNGYYTESYTTSAASLNKIAIIESITDDTKFAANRGSAYDTNSTLVGATGILTVGSTAPGGAYENYTGGVAGIWFTDDGDGTYTKAAANTEGATKVDQTSYFCPFFNKEVYDASAYKIDDEYTWYEFKISSPATIYVGQNRGGWTLGTDAGWTLVTDGSARIRGWELYSKHYNAGETVKVPIRGGFGNPWADTQYDTFALLVMWDDKAPKSTNAKLSALTYQAGSSAAETVTGFEPANEGGTYNVILPEGTTSVTVAATKANSKASDPVYSAAGGVLDVTSGSGTITVTTLAEDTETTYTYTINFTVLQPDNYDLKTLTYNGISVPDFDVDTLTYTIYYPTADSVTIAATPADAMKTAAIDKTSLTPSAEGDVATIVVGEGSEAKTYTVKAILDDTADKVLNMSGDFKNTTVDTISGDVSEYFIVASKVSVLNTDDAKAAYFSDAYNGGDANSFWLEFMVSSDATVCFVDTVSAFDATASWIKPAGWDKVGTSNDLSIKLSETVTASAANGNLYKKKVSAGEVIQLPGYGSMDESFDASVVEVLPFCIIVWDSSIVTPPVSDGEIEYGGDM